MLAPVTKACSGCGNMFPASGFPVKGKHRTAQCKPCRNRYMREWNAKNREAVRERHKEYKRRYPEAYRDSHLRHLFGISLAQYEEMLTAQGGVCAICKNPETALHNRTKMPKRLAVDHCHDSGAVRGLLCSGCNTGLGNFKDSRAALEAALAYLSKDH